jgi:formate-dependent nitrite reductase membrane component NrfD
MSWQNTTKKVAGAIAVLSGIWMALSVSLGDVFNIIASPEDVSAEVMASFGGSISFIDRIAVLGVLVTVLGGAGLGVLSVSKDNPPFLNTTLVYLPVIVGFLAFSAFGTEVYDTITGARDWNASDDIQNSYMLFLASSLVSGAVTLLKK